MRSAVASPRCALLLALAILCYRTHISRLMPEEHLRLRAATGTRGEAREASVKRVASVLD